MRPQALVWLVLCGIWGSTWLAIKLGLRDLPPLTFAGLLGAVPAVVIGGAATIAVAALWGRMFPQLAARDRLIA